MIEFQGVVFQFLIESAFERVHAGCFNDGGWQVVPVFRYPVVKGIALNSAYAIFTRSLVYLESMSSADPPLRLKRVGNDLLVVLGKMLIHLDEVTTFSSEQ